MHHGAESGEGKGKGKERERGDDEDEDGDWRRKKSYKYLIKDVPGRHSLKRPVARTDGEHRSAMKDLQEFVLEPEKQIIGITPFERGERDPWHVSDEPIRQWAMSQLQAESSAAREERKRKKELKKQAKQATAPSTPTTPIALQQQQQANNTRGGTPATPATAAPLPPAPRTAGIKREREVDSLPPRPHVNGAPPGPGMAQTPNGAGLGGGAIKAGVDGVRPRPKKKQRLVSLSSHFILNCSQCSSRPGLAGTRARYAVRRRSAADTAGRLTVLPVRAPSPLRSARPRTCTRLRASQHLALSSTPRRIIGALRLSPTPPGDCLRSDPVCRTLRVSSPTWEPRRPYSLRTRAARALLRIMHHLQSNLGLVLALSNTVSPTQPYSRIHRSGSDTDIYSVVPFLYRIICCAVQPFFV